MVMISNNAVSASATGSWTRMTRNIHMAGFPGAWYGTDSARKRRSGATENTEIVSRSRSGATGS